MEPIDLATANADQITSWLQSRYDAFSTYFACRFDGSTWLETLHIVPQAYVQFLRRSDMAGNDKYSDYFRDRIADLFSIKDKVSKGVLIKARKQLHSEGKSVACNVGIFSNGF